MKRQTVRRHTQWMVGFTLVAFCRGPITAESSDTLEQNPVQDIATPAFGIRAAINPNRDPAIVKSVANILGRDRSSCATFCKGGHGDMNGILSVVTTGDTQTTRGPDHVSKLSVDAIEPDFNIITLPTTLRLPHNTFAFRLTHRFSRPLDGGSGFGNLLEDFFGFDSPAFIGLGLRYGIAPGAQVGIYRNNNKNIQIFGRYNLLEDFFGFDSPAFIGLGLRYGIAPGAQVGIYRNNNKNIQIFGRYNLLWQGSDSGTGSMRSYRSRDSTISVTSIHRLSVSCSHSGFRIARPFTSNRSGWATPISWHSIPKSDLPPMTRTH